jgi:hypothetical protein
MYRHKSCKPWEDGLFIDFYQAAWTVQPALSKPSVKGTGFCPGPASGSHVWAHTSGPAAAPTSGPAPRGLRPTCLLKCVSGRRDMNVELFPTLSMFVSKMNAWGWS